MIDDQISEEKRRLTFSSQLCTKLKSVQPVCRSTCCECSVTTPWRISILFDARHRSAVSQPVWLLDQQVWKSQWERLQGKKWFLICRHHSDRQRGGRRSGVIISYSRFLFLPVFILLIFSFYVFLWRRKSDSGSEIIDEGKEKGGGGRGGAHHPSSVLLLMPQWTGSFILLSGESLPPFLLPSDSSPLHLTSLPPGLCPLQQWGDQGWGSIKGWRGSKRKRKVVLIPRSLRRGGSGK